MFNKNINEPNRQNWLKKTLTALPNDTNAVGTLNLLEAARQYCPEAPFVHMSTNKVYGDAPNLLPLVELNTRWEYADDAWTRGSLRLSRSINPSTPYSAPPRLRPT